MKIVINKCYGGFSLSDAAIMLYGKKAGINIIKDEKNSSSFICHYYIDEIKDDNYFSDHRIERTDPILIEVVKELGEAADGRCAKLRVVEIPDDVKWYISDYDGIQEVHEEHRKWS
jgi:hypothetical protein